MLPVDRTSVLARLMSGIFIAALLVACAAPPAAPVAPAATLIPPTPPPDPTAAVEAWIDAINSSDIDAALALMTPDARMSGVFNGSPPDILGWFIGIDSRNGIPDCQPQDDRLACNFTHNDGCITGFGAADGLPVKMTFTLREHKIQHVSIEEVGSEWANYSKWLDAESKWVTSNRTEESSKMRSLTPREAGGIAIKLCQDYAVAVETQAQDPTNVVQAWLEALNKGDLDAVLALMTTGAKMSGVFTGSPTNVLDFWIGLTVKHGVPICLSKDTQLVCDITMSDDGCIVASGDTDGLPVRYTFAFQDGKIQAVNVAVVDWENYGEWLGEEGGWASVNRAKEWAQTAGFSRESGAMSVKLCQEYAETLK